MVSQMAFERIDTDNAVEEDMINRCLYHYQTRYIGVSTEEDRSVKRKIQTGATLQINRYSYFAFPISSWTDESYS